MYYDNDDLILISITMVFFNLLLEWPQMCEVRRNLEKYGVAYPSKFDRSVLKRRSISCDETDEDIKSKLSKLSGQ